ncbi:MAG: MurR/RpiR family transcriptional regulator [Acidimicrobiia bacterium]|nr:MurR/RpiR family transcriptional regulator [Acidimicrobiia bacterium]
MPEMEVTERVRAAGPHLTAAERRVAQIVLSRPQLVGFGTVADLAAASDAGAATVVRLAAKLGFDGFSALQASVQDDLARQLRPAAERIREVGGDHPIERHRSAELSNVQATLDAVRGESLDAVVDLLADLARPVVVLAGEAERGVALQFANELAALRPDVTMVEGSAVAVGRQLALSMPHSTLLVVDLRRYERWVLDAAEQGRGAGHTVVALSDGLLSPLAMKADHSFVIAAGSVSPFDSHVGTLALLDLLVATTAERLRTTAADRLQRVEAAWAAATALTDG